MKYSSALLLGLAASVGLAFGQYDQDDIDSGKVLQNLSQEAFDNALARLDGKTEGCTPENVRVRKEW